jgi:hypothetical protein
VNLLAADVGACRAFATDPHSAYEQIILDSG